MYVFTCEHDTRRKITSFEVMNPLTKNKLFSPLQQLNKNHNTHVCLQVCVFVCVCAQGDNKKRKLMTFHGRLFAKNIYTLFDIFDEFLMDLCELFSKHNCEQQLCFYLKS